MFGVYMGELGNEFSGVASFLSDREFRYLLASVRVTVKQALASIEFGSVGLKECRQGDLIEV